MKKEQIIKILRRMGTVACALILVLSTLVTFLLAWIQTTILSEDFFVNACDEEYLEDLQVYLKRNLSGEFARFEESEEVQNRLANQCLDMDAVTLCTRDHLRSLYQSLIHGAELTDAVYPAEEFAPFREYVHALSKETGDVVDEQVLDDLVAELADGVSYDINCFHFHLVGFSSTTIIRMVYEKIDALRGLLSLSFWIPLVLALAAGAGFFFLSRESSVVKKGYWLNTCLWGATALLFFPLVLFQAYDLPSRLAITESPVKSLLDSILYHLTDGIVIPVSIVFALATAGILFWIVWQMRDYAQKLKEQAPSNAENALALTDPQPEAPAALSEGQAALPEGEDAAEESPSPTDEEKTDE